MTDDNPYMALAQRRVPEPEVASNPYMALAAPAPLGDIPTLETLDVRPDPAEYAGALTSVGLGDAYRAPAPAFDAAALLQPAPLQDAASRVGGPAVRPTRTLPELGTDVGTMFRTGAREGLAALGEAPWTIVNAINGATNAAAGALADALGGSAGPGIPMVEVPQALRDFRNAGQSINAEAHRLDGSATMKYDEQARPDDFLGTLGYIAENPTSILPDAARSAGSMTSGIVPGSTALTIGLQATQQAQLAAQQVESDLLASGADPQHAKAEAAKAFAVAEAIGVIAPRIVPGGNAFEELLSGQVGRRTGTLAGRVAVPLLGETASEAAEEGGVQVTQNVFSGRPAGEGVGSATALGGLLGLGMGAAPATVEGVRAFNELGAAPASLGEIDPALLARGNEALTEPLGGEVPVAAPAPPAPAPAAPARAPAASVVEQPAAAPADPVVPPQIEELAKALPPDVVDAALAALGEPVEAPPAMDATPAAPVAPTGTAPAVATKLDFGDRTDDQLDAEYDALTDERGNQVTEGGRRLDTDLVRELSPEYRADRVLSPQIHDAASAFTRRRFAKMLAAPVAPGRDNAVLFTAGGGGSGKSTAIEGVVGDTNADIVYDGTLSSIDRARRDITAALKTGRDVRIVYVYRSPANSAASAIGRAIKSRRPVPVSVLADAHAKAGRVAKAIAQEYSGDSRVEVVAIDNDGEAGKAKRMPLSAVPEVDKNEAESVFRAALEEARATGTLDDALYAAFDGRTSDVEVGAGPDRQSEPQREGRGRDAVVPSDGDAEAQSPPDPDPPTDRPPTGTKNAVTDAERAAANRDPILRDAMRSNEDTLAEAMRTLKADPAAGPEAVARMSRGGAEGITLADEAVMLVYKTELLNERDAASKKLADESASEAAKEVARRTWEESEAKITAIDIAAVNAGSEWGRFGQFRQRMLRADFTLEALERKERARLERPLTAEESATVKAMAAKIADLQAKVDRLQERAANAASEATFEAVTRRMSRTTRQRRTLESLRKAADDARARLAAAPEVPSRRKQSGAVMSPALLADYAVIGAYHIANGAATLSDWVRAMSADLGDAFDRFKAEHPSIFKAAQRETARPLKADATVAEVMSNIDLANVQPKDVRRLVEALVGEGMRGEPAVIGAAAKRLSLEESEVRALFVQTEPRGPLTVSEAQQEIRDLRKLARLQNEIERLEAGAPKPPTGAAAVDSPEVAAKKVDLADLRKRLRPVRDPEVQYQEMRGRQIEKRIAELQARIDAGDFAALPRVPRALSEANQRAVFELEKAKHEFLRHQFEDTLRQRSPIRKVFGGVADTFNLARAVMTSLDLSAILRQGGFITFGHPIRGMSSVGPSLRAFASEKAEFRIKSEIESRANAPLYAKYGLQLTGIGAGPLTQIEEAYSSRWLDRFPAWVGGGLVRGSGRSYTAFLNKLRADSFDAMAAALGRRATLTDAEGKAIANFINVATGRGKVGTSENAGQVLNTVFFAPRLVASRFQLLVGQPLYGGTPRTRKMIATEYARFLLGVGVATGLAAFALAGDDDDKDSLIGFDPRSADFLKIRIGSTYLDPMVGLAQVTVLLGRLGTGETVSPSGAKPLRPQYTLTDLRRALGEDIPAHKIEDDKKLPFGMRSAADVIGSFMRSKLAPVPGAIVNTLAGSNMVGEEMTPSKVAVEMVTPMSISNIGDVMEEHGAAKGTTLMLLGMLGMGMQQRDEKSPLTATDDARTKIRARLAKLPAAQWNEELTKMRTELGPVADGVELAFYKDDGKYGKAGEPRRTKDGAPVLETERLSDPKAMNANYQKQLESQGLSSAEAAARRKQDQIHHIIPDNVTRQHPLMIVARKNGYDLDESSNLIGLAGAPSSATESGAEIGHWADHPRYDGKVVERLDKAARALRREHGSLQEAPVQEVMDAVRKVEDEMRKKIESKDVPTKGGRLAALDDDERSPAFEART